ncbi:hypothetical protein PDESU_00481 [Pontiella desulfatans]|uniref:Translocation and assembly module TamB C-terminal domain-containing protein n=1 Tax=Pontiella desulfatans TaxID=2750659 RepID=A0A6C2TWG6_PONDE|nr:translocation/assembly module TamB [Pontiella desulfatans]VGO11933.1 hypothetical protein PDESU_00481 [Pontiella desulfatans]
MKKRISRLLKLLLLLALLPVLLFALIQTPPGKTAVASALSKLLSSPDHLDVRIGGITGWIPGDLNIAEFEIGDGHGVWLSARNLHCRWMIRELLDERIRFARLGAEEIVLHRFPKSGGRPVAGPRERTEFQPYEMHLDGLNIKRFRLERGVAGIPLEYTVHSGGIAYLSSGRLNGELMVGGDAEGRVELDALLTGCAEDNLGIKVALQQMSNPTFGLDGLSGQGSATINAQGVEARIEADVGEAGRLGRISTMLQFAGSNLRLRQFEFIHTDYSAIGELALAFSPGLIDVSLDSSFTDASTNHYGIHGLVAVSTSNGTWGVDVGTLEIEGWNAVAFTLAGTVDPEQVSLSGALKEFDVALLPIAGSSNFTGTVRGDISVTGSLADPSVVAGVRVEGFSSAQEALDELPELDFGINAGVKDGRLFADTTLTNYASGHFAASAAIPCGFSIAPFHFKPSLRAADARVEADLDLGIFNQLAMFQNQLIGGLLTTEITYSNQTPNGYLWIADGRYEHYDWGILFRDFDAGFNAVPGGFEVGHAIATDGASGAVGMEGGLGKGGLDLQLVFDGANIIRRDEIEAKVSGLLKVEGSPFHPDISGTLVIDRAEILLDNIPSAPPPVLTNLEEQPTNAVAVAGQKVRKPPPVGLDVRVELPQVFVNASMIETLLVGNLLITDTPRGVSVKGKIEPRRGFVNFIGKKFRFTDGDIVFDGAVPTEAILDNLTSEYSRRDVTARLVLNGRANDPRFRLESTPAMPEDEVLSHVLFNRDTSSISPYQAYQIAAAARQLSGGLNGPGFMYQVRQAVGVDTLEWRESEVAGEASEVVAGKYISSGLYVEVSRSLDARGQTDLMAEFEVTRHFSLETYTGPKMRPGIGANWRYDY